MVRYFYGGVALYLVTFFLVWYQPWEHWSAVCDHNELLAVCIREWVGSLSGWFGGVAAFATIWFIIGQLSEQKRQNDFLVGDAKPTMDVTPDLDDPSLLVIRVVNWNRRGILIRAFNLNLELEKALIEVKRNGVEVGLAKLQWPVPVHGWEDRATKGPSVLQLKIAAALAGELVRDWPTEAIVQVTAHILGDKHDVIILEAAVCP